MQNHIYKQFKDLQTIQREGTTLQLKVTRFSELGYSIRTEMEELGHSNPGNLVDRISDLPDSILSIILSSIPTKNAVGTSVLSKRWKSSWKAVHNLDFCLDVCICYSEQCDGECSKRHAEDDVRFTCFVNNVLLLHDGGFLNKFSLVWKFLYFPSPVISWIRTAITRNVHELYVCLESFHSPFEIPSSLFSCETLKSLELNGGMLVSDSIAVCLPRLESIKLGSVFFQSNEVFQKLIRECPVLNFLSVKMNMDIMSEYAEALPDTWMMIFFTFIITSTSLRHLILDVESFFEYIEDLPYCILELEAPALEYLRLEGFVPEIFVRGSLSSLVKADINLTISENELSDANICNSLVEAIRAFHCAKSLRLSEYVLSALSRATIGLSTEFKRLTELSTGASFCYCSSILDFILNSDSLEVLTFHKDFFPWCLHSANSHTHSNWTTPVEVPRCLSNSLKTVQFEASCGSDYERELICYMLLHGVALKDMTVYYVDHDDKLEFMISAFPRMLSV